VDRELVLGILAPVLAGLALQLGALWPRAEFVLVGSSGFSERRAWQRIWLPFVPLVLTFCALGGWAVREPEQAESVPVALRLLSVPFMLIWIRAVCRATRALRHPPDLPAAGVTGLWRPRVVLSDRFRARIDDRAAAAAVAHEAAHVRHRDPLRLWLAQFATDLQWPSPCAVDRLRAWARVVEFARDDEARGAGVDGPDLAAAIIAAVQLREADRCALALAGDPVDFDTRIRRLLTSPPPDTDVPSSARLFAVVAAPALALAVLAGVIWGEAFVRTVFSVLP
jgi:hypothetical protein